MWPVCATPCRRRWANAWAMSATCAQPCLGSMPRSSVRCPLIRCSAGRKPSFPRSIAELIPAQVPARYSVLHLIAPLVAVLVCISDHKA